MFLEKLIRAGIVSFQADWFVFFALHRHMPAPVQ